MSKSQQPVVAAGAVCWRNSPAGLRVLLVHRPHHGDLSLPKGKVDPGELPPETAVREIAEETGYAVSLGVPLGASHYALPGGRPKVVHYWAAYVSEKKAAVAFTPNSEVDELRWVDLDEARRTLSYPHDVEIVDRLAALHESGRARTFALIVLRHGKAVPHSGWAGRDSERPLLPRGTEQAIEVAPAVAAWGPKTIISSTAARCLATVHPLARLTGLQVFETPALSQDAHEAGTADVGAVVAKRLEARRSAVLCSHGPVIPELVDAIAAVRAPGLRARVQAAGTIDTGAFSVLHLRRGEGEPELVAVEAHGTG